MLRSHVDEHLVGADIELDDGLILFAIRRCDGGHDTLSLTVIRWKSRRVVAGRSQVHRAEALSRAIADRDENRAGFRCGIFRDADGLLDTVPARSDVGEEWSSPLRR